MRLLSYMPSAGIPASFGDGYVRALIVEDCDIAVGHHEHLEAFTLRLTDIDVIEYEGLTYLCIKSFDNIRTAVSEIDYLSEEYRKWFGKKAYVPSVDAVTEAHILKGRMPTLLQDFDNFVAWFKDQLASIERLDMANLTFTGCRLYDAAVRGTYDLWEIYRHYLRLDGKMDIGYTPTNEIQVNDLHISANGVSWWLIEHNKQLQEIAQQNDLHTIFLDFKNDARQGSDYAYYFVGREGNYVKRPVDESEFRHMAIHGLFPEIIIADEGKSLNIKFDYMDFFTQRYHDFNNYAWRTSDNVVNLMRFI